MQTKNRCDWKCANENLLIKTFSIKFARKWGASVKLAPPNLFFLITFLLKMCKHVQTCANDEQSNELRKFNFFKCWGANFTRV